MRDRSFMHGKENGELRECSQTDINEPFVFKMKNGYDFRIDTLTFVSLKSLKLQLSEQKRVEIKFCVRDDEDFPSNGKIEQWELVLFPMYKDGEEISHGAVVDFSDSAVNGNLVVEDGKVVGNSSNHCLLGYKEVQDPVTNFAVICVENLLTNL